MAAGWRLLTQALWFVTVGCLVAGWFFGNSNLKAMGVAAFALQAAAAYAARARAQRAKGKQERHDEPIVPR